MLGLQPTHLLIIIVVVVIFFVPSRLPELGRAVRQTIVELRTSLKEIDRDTPAEPHHRIDSEK